MKTESSAVMLRDIMTEDLSLFFAHQLDADANYMAGFTAKDPTNRESFEAHWVKILADDLIFKQAILYQGQVVGHIVSFLQFDEREIAYWIDKAYWGKGITTQALTLFLTYVSIRPLFGRAVKDNLASIRVLEKCGFVKIGEDRGFANARGQEVDEVILKLDL